MAGGAETVATEEQKGTKASKELPVSAKEPKGADIKKELGEEPEITKGSEKIPESAKGVPNETEPKETEQNEEKHPIIEHDDSAGDSSRRPENSDFSEKAHSASDGKTEETEAENSENEVEYQEGVSYTMDQIDDSVARTKTEDGKYRTYVWTEYEGRMGVFVNELDHPMVYMKKALEVIMAHPGYELDTSYSGRSDFWCCRRAEE